jgi:hypothetical protein
VAVAAVQAQLEVMALLLLEVPAALVHHLLYPVLQ